MDGFMSSPFDLLLGRRTYDIFAGYWPDHKEEPRWGKPFNSAKKYVVSHKPSELSWTNSMLITGDVVAEIKWLKTQTVLTCMCGVVATLYKRSCDTTS